MYVYNKNIFFSIFFVHLIQITRSDFAVGGLEVRQRFPRFSFSLVLWMCGLSSKRLGPGILERHPKFHEQKLVFVSSWFIFLASTVLLFPEIYGQIPVFGGP